MKNFNVYINNTPVNVFDNEDDAYNFACAIKDGETMEDYDEDSDTISYEDESGINELK